jgi:CheY-like chemotaxis protein
VSDRRGFSRPKLLLIDDEEDLLDVLGFELEAAGIGVTPVTNGAAGVEAARRARFDIVVTDLKMPGMNGLETTKALRQLDPGLPVILVTGYAWNPPMDTDGILRVLMKPFRLEQILDAISHALATTGGTAAREVGA